MRTTTTMITKSKKIATATTVATSAATLMRTTAKATVKT